MTRRVLSSLAAIAIAAVVLRPPEGVAAQTRATATNVASDSARSRPQFLQEPAGIYTGENMGIATSSKGAIYIYHRANETRLFEYSPQGMFVREIGRNNYGFAFAHSVRVDAQDNVWAVDEGTDMLIKFSPAGKVLMTIGRREDPVAMLSNLPGTGAFHGRNAKYRFGRQTDVAFDQQGNIFVSDGYFDARVVKYDRDGRFVKAVGTRGNGQLQFNTPHSIATDFQGNVYVGDRGNARVQVLDNDLNWKANYSNVGNPWAVCVSGGPGPKNPGKQYLFVSNSWPDSAPAASGRVHRGGVQDGAGRHDPREVRSRRQGGGGVRHHPSNGLPRPECDLHRRDQQLAVAEDSAEARRVARTGRPLRGAHHVTTCSRASGPCDGDRRQPRRANGAARPAV